MNKQQASDLIQRTFPKAFDKARFRNFAINVVNKLDETKRQQWPAQVIKDAFKAHVRRYESLGTYTNEGRETLDVLIVYLTAESKLEHARTAIRNFVADHLKRNEEKDAALVAFVSPTERQWRLSYVKMEYATVQKKSGVIGVETRLTPARRFSYIVGEGESCHTAQTRFLGLLQDTESNPTLAQFEDAFSVEAVTEEFFGKYVELFNEVKSALDLLVDKDEILRDDFETKGVNAVDFAKKLMGQIVFLYFLQKKGWLGVEEGQDWGTGQRNFLRQLFEREQDKHENFFNDTLEPLFYDTLATDRGHEAWCNRLECRIPFLNGGLFEPLGSYDWKKTNINLPNRLFRNNVFVEEGIIGTGVLDVFDRYNFTVNEAEPLDIEVAIDPEMLGKVFERMIEENRRKGLGAFYTPREIVHYMCQESLIAYLNRAVNRDKELVPRTEIDTFIRLGEQIAHYEAVDANYRIRMPKAIQAHSRILDDALKSITVCDPAVGSGAFPVGMMTEIVRARGSLTPYFNTFEERTPYYFKRHAIEHCLYGVDIDPGATEIAKLRLWLSLVVDEVNVQQIKPLPNLDYKIVSGNSLLGVEKTLFNDLLFQQLESLKPSYFNESNIAIKAVLKQQIDTCIRDLTSDDDTFDFEIFFSEITHLSSGFDVVIANPPYLGEKGNKDTFRRIAKGELGKRFYRGKMDLFYFFFHLALDLASDAGTIAFITTNYYITATGGYNLRRDFQQRATVRRMINFNEVRIFKSAQGQHNMITILEKGHDPEALAKNCIAKEKGFVAEGFLNAILSNQDAVTNCIEVPNADLYEGDDLYIRLQGDISAASDSTSLVLNKIKAARTTLGDVCNINSGIQTGCDRLKVAGQYQGVFVLHDSEIGKIPETERELLRPFFKNSDIKRYYSAGTAPRHVIYTDRDFGQPMAYPTIISHLRRFRARLDEIREVKNGLINYYQLQWPRRETIFKGAKIVAPQRSKRNTFAYNEQDWYASVDVYFITEKAPSVSLKYILGILNSKLLYFWLYHRGKRKGEMLELYQKPLSQIPIVLVPAQQQKPYITIIDRILEAKLADFAADTSALEGEIDELVYTLYGLTQEEKALVKAAAE